MTEARCASVPSESAGKREAKGSTAERPGEFPTCVRLGVQENILRTVALAESCHGFSHERHHSCQAMASQHAFAEGEADGVRQHLLGARARHRRNRACAHHEGSLQLAVHRHPGRRPLAHRVSTPSAPWTPSSAATFVPTGGTEEDAITTGLIPVAGRQRGHLRLPGDAGHLGCAHQRHGCFGRVRHAGRPRHVKSRVGAQLATFVLGVLIFVDDYFNCLTVGSVMRPVTDGHQHLPRQACLPHRRDRRARCA